MTSHGSQGSTNAGRGRAGALRAAIRLTGWPMLLAWGVLELMPTGCSYPPPRIVMHGTHVVLYSAMNDEESQYLLQEADQTVENVANVLGIDSPRVPTRVMLFDSRWALRSYLRECCPDLSTAAAVCFEGPDSSCVVALSSRGAVSETARLLRHEVTHATVAARFDELPPWIHEGLAKYFEDGPPCRRIRPDLLKPIVRQVRHGDLLLERLVALPPHHSLTEKEYAQAWALTHFLLNETPYGPLVVRSYLMSVRRDGDPNEQFRKVFGRVPAVLEPEWRSYVLDMEKRKEPGG